MTGLAVPIPYTWQVGDTGNAALLNGQIRDPMTFLLNPPLFEASQNSAQAFTNNIVAVMQLQNLIADTYGGWNSTTWTYTIPVTGTYQIDMSSQWAGNATGIRYSQLTQNGSASTTLISQVSAGSSTVTAVASGPVACTAGDTLQMRGNQTSGGALSTQASGGYNSLFAIRFVHA